MCYLCYLWFIFNALLKFGPGNRVKNTFIRIGSPAQKTFGAATGVSAPSHWGGAADWFSRLAVRGRPREADEDVGVPGGRVRATSDGNGAGWADEFF